VTGSTKPPLVTVVVPSFNQGKFLERALQSVIQQDVSKEIIVMDGGSSDESVDIIKQYQQHITYWQSKKDGGQANAINAGMVHGRAPFVCWLNSDDIFMPNGLSTLLSELEVDFDAPAVYGKCWHIDEQDKKVAPYLSFKFSKALLANYCFIAQPATLVRRECWEAVGGLNENFNYAMDYDFWLRLYKQYGKLKYVRTFCAANRLHSDTKTHNFVEMHYKESMDAVNQAFGYIPIKWTMALPIMRVVRKLASIRYR